MKTPKRILSIVLAALLLFGGGLFALADDNPELPLPDGEIDWLSDEMTEFFQTASDEELSALVAQAFTPAAGENTSAYPIVFGAGAWHEIYTDEEPWMPKAIVTDVFGQPTTMETVFSPSTTLGADADAMDAIIKSVTSLNMNGFGDAMVQLWKNSYGPIAMDRNGESINPAVSCVIPYLTFLGKKYSTFVEDVPAYLMPLYEALDKTMYDIKWGNLLKDPDTGEVLEYLYPPSLDDSWSFWTFDWRLDPWYNAGLLHDYFEKIIRLYGEGNTHAGGNHNGYYGEPFDKVNFNAISGSGPIALAYLKRYGTEYMASLCFNISMHAGSTLFGNLALGGFGFDAASLAFGGLSMFGLQDSKTNFGLDSLGGVIKGLYYVGALDILLNGFNFAARGAYQKFYDQALIPIWFQMPCYVGMIPHDKYDLAKEYLFKHNTKYNKLLEMTDRYQYDVMAIENQLILDAASKIKLSVRSGYGVPLSPYAIGSNVSSDKLVDTYYSSLGATCAPPGSPFARSYKQKVTSANNYVSPDRMVDASTCLLPDVTWFAKDLPHTAQWDYSGWYGWWLAEDTNYTIRGNDNYPQYSQWTEKTEGERADKFYTLKAPELNFWGSLWEGMKDFGLSALTVWRWVLLLPMAWMKW